MPKQLTPEELAAFDAAPGLTPEQLAAFDALPAPGPEGQTPAAPEAEEGNTLAPDTTLGAAARGFAQGGTFGFADEAGGALGAVDELARRALGSGGVYGDKPLREALVERYLLERNANRRELAQAEKARPVVAGLAALGGGLALPVPGAGAVSNLGARALSAAPNVGRFVAQGAVAGGLMGFGAGEGLGDMASGAMTGAVGGAVAGPIVTKVAEKVTPTAADMANKLREIARTRALKTVMIQKDLKKIPLERQKQIADVALDSGTIEPWNNADDLLPKYEAARKDAGETIGTILGDIDNEMAAKAGLPDGKLATVRRAVAERRQADAERVASANAAEKGRAAAEREAEELRQAVAAEKQRAAKAFYSSQLEQEASVLDGMRESGNIRPLRTDAELQALVEKQPPGPQRSKAIRDLVERRVLTPNIRPRPIQPAAVAAPAPESEILKDLGVPMKDAVAMLRREVVPLFDDPALSTQAAEIERLIAGYENQAARGVTLQKAADFKSSLQDTINNFADTPASQKARLNTQRVIDDFVEGQVLRQAGPDALREYVNEKLKYGAFAQLAARGKEAVDRNAGNRAVSLTDHGVGGTAALSASDQPWGIRAAIGAAASFANKQVRERGSSTAAVYADRLSKYLRSPEANRSPAVNFMLEEYGPTLRAFAARGPAAAATAYYLMSQRDQRFRELDEQAQKEVTER